jgi:energy-coupling factor transporter ATP-binding protein EcfA2
MYIERLSLKNVKTFVDETLEFVHPDQAFRARGKPADNGSPLLPKPRLPNVNLLLGENGSGKSTVLRAIAMAVLGPSFPESNLPTQGLVRRGRGMGAVNEGEKTAEIDATLFLHEQDHSPGERLDSQFKIKRRGDLDVATFFDSAGALWEPVFESKNDAFFAVGYGATRRVEPLENYDRAGRSRLSFLRAQRVKGLFEDSFSLIPLKAWLPGLGAENPGLAKEVGHLLNRLLKPAHCTYTGMWKSGRASLFEHGDAKWKRVGDSLFEHGGVWMEFRDLSDGYRAFIGWAADMLFHACYGCPRGKKLIDLCGVIIVDEIDLHLHPRWQMKVISTIARAFPHMQFILTSHSPLVAGSLEWMNIIMLKLNRRSNSTHAGLLRRESIHGLDADQVLVSDFFGLSTTRAPEKANKLDALTLKARGGDDDAARQLLAELAKGMEEVK